MASRWQHMDCIDTSTAAGCFFVNVMTALAEKERECMQELMHARLQATLTLIG